MLLTKPGKALDVLSKRRDICLQPHSLKLCANAVAPHYVELQEHVQPEANTGFRERGAATTTALWLGLTKEEAASERKGWYCGFIDKGGFFQSCVRRAQRVVEARFGVPTSITNLIMAIHEALVVRYDSGMGITHGTESYVGNGQGDSIAPMRSMIPLAIETRAVEWLVAGFQFVAPRGVQRTRTPQGWFADDGALVVDSLRALQQAFTVSSAMARVLGFTVGIDVDAKGVPTGDKTGWMGSEWRDGQWTEAGDDVTIRLIDGRKVPRVQGYYKHLGIRHTPKADWGVARQVVTHRCGGIASALSRLGVLTAEEYIDTVDAATTTVVAYYGATFPIGRKACETIDVAKRRGLARMGHAGERTSRRLAHAPRPHGLGMAITWAHAAAALVVEVDRAINMPETAPAHVAVTSRVAKEFWRWGWRPSPGARVPLMWNPTWIYDTLTEEGIVEAWQLYLQTAMVRTSSSAGGSGCADALANNYRMPDDPLGADAPVWEREGRTYGRRLARLGGTLRRHFLADNGGWRSEKDLGEYLGRGGSIVGGRRINARLTTAEAREYRTLLQQFQPDENEWASTQRPGTRERPAEVHAVEVLSAGGNEYRGMEYLIEHSDGTVRWGRRPRAKAPGMTAKLREAREQYLVEGELTIERHIESLLGGTSGALWLATKAPLAVGARPIQDILTEAAKVLGEGWFRPPHVAERTAARMEPGSSIAQGARLAAQEAYTAAEMADRATEDEAQSPGERATLAEKAEAAWAWAAVMDVYAASLDAPAPERAARQQSVDKAYAEWIAASARAATSATAKAVIEWAQALPEHDTAADANAEGAYAAAEADERSPAKRFRPSARPECFMGSIGPVGADGRTRKQPSLELSDAQRRAASSLPPCMPIPEEQDLEQDPRVAWDGTWRQCGTHVERVERMWNAAPRRLGWKLTKDQLLQVQRQLDAALVRRAASRRTSHTSTAHPIVGPLADETPTDENHSSTPAYGTNRIRQQMAEAMAAEERADEAADAALEEEWGLTEWSAAEIEAAEREADTTGAGDDDVEDGWDAVAAMEAYDEAENAAEAYLREDTADQHDREWADDLTTAQQRHIAKQHVLALERKQHREVEESQSNADALATKTAAAEQEWQRKKAEALEARQAANARMLASEGARALSWTTNYQEANSKDKERQAAERRVDHARTEEQTARDADARQTQETAQRIQKARARLARLKRAEGDEADITDAERDALERDEREAEALRETARQRAAAQEAVAEAERAARARAADTANRLRAAREATTEALRALDGSDERTRRGERLQEERAEEETRYAHVEYWDALTPEQRAAILTSPTLRLCARHREMEQREAMRATDGRIDVSMEPKERRNIDTATTKRAAAIGLAIERRYGIQYAYAVDGSKDDVEAWGEHATGERAAAWGAWDGITAYGGALPPGTGNQEAELYAIERVLARHERGDRILIMGDCQAALALVDTAWRSGRAGTGSPAHGKTGGLLIEAIIRHRLRITSRKGNDAPRGSVCFMWVKAHGGGVAPNAYADAIAKSCLTADVDFDTVDAPYRTLPRACLYMAQPAPRNDTWELGNRRFSCIAADRSLRNLIIDGVTRHVIARLPQQSHSRCDERVVAEVTCTHGRPVGATTGTGPRHGMTEPTETGRAMRLRSDDLRQRNDACPLCQARGPHAGDHVMRCNGIPREHRDAAMAQVAAALQAAADSLPSGERQAPAENTLHAWREAAHRAGQHGAVAALGQPTTGTEPRAPSNAYDWARRGWRKKGEVYELDLHSETEKTDWKIAVWGAVAVRSAYASAAQAASAENATAEVAQACAEATRRLEDGPLGSAHRAAGDAAVDEHTGEPYITPRTDGGGIGAVRLRFAPLQPHNLAHMHDWTGRRSWLPVTRATAETASWFVHTHKGFRSEGGAAGRKEEQTVAVDTHDLVYKVAAPATWPWLVEYEMDGYEATRQDGTDGARTLTTIRLGYAAGANTALVRTRFVQADGQRYRDKDDAISVVTELRGDTDGRGLRAMFWDVALGGHVTTQGAQATVRRAAAAATVRCQGGEDGEHWSTLRRVLGGEIPPPTLYERMEAQRARRETCDAAAQAAEAHTRAALNDAQRGRDSAPVTARISMDAERMRRAATELGVDVDATRPQIRRAYLREAFDAHPDKGGSATAFQKLYEAYQDLDGTSEEARRGAAREIRDGHDAAGRDRHNAGRDAERTEARLQDTIAKAKAAAVQRAKAEWTPPGKVAAGHLREASGAFMQLWTRYQGRVIRHLNKLARDVPGANYKTHGERQAAAAVVRRAERRHAREKAKQQAVDEMRREEQRVTNARREAAEAAAAILRRRGAQAYTEAARMDSAALTQEYRVKLPWAMWKEFPDSDRYELYEIAEIDPECKFVTLERSGASHTERKRKIRKGARPTWNRFTVDWECFTGVRRYGTDQRGIVIVHKDSTAETSEEDEGTDEEERQQQGLEARRAAHRATRLMEEARVADREAAKLLRDGARIGQAHTAAEDELRREEADGSDDVPSDDSEGERRDMAPDATPRVEAGEGGTPSARRRGPWSGKNWAREAWTGPVAAAEYAIAWREDPLQRPPRSKAADAAHRKAHQVSLEANQDGNQRATATAIRETARRRGGLWGAAADAEAVDDQRSAVAHLAHAAQQWRARTQPERQQRNGTETALATAAAADALQRKRPAADTVDAAARKRAMLDIAQIIADTGAHLENPGGSSVERARRVLQRALGDSSESIGSRGQRGAELLVAAVLDNLQGTSEADGETLRVAPQDAGDDGSWEEPPEAGDDAGIQEDDDDGGAEARTAEEAGIATVHRAETETQSHAPTDATRAVRRPSLSIAIRVGNLHAQGHAAQRQEGVIDRRVDRTTACGNPFLIAPNNDRERNAACRAYADLIHGGPGSPNVRKLATEYGLRVDPRFDRPEATQARDEALRQLERDVLSLQQGTSIRLMCHCAPKRCHAHAIANEIRRRLLTRGVDIHVDDGDWEGPPEDCMDADTYADNDDEDTEARTVEEAGIAAARQTDPGTPSHTPTGTTSAPEKLPGCWVSRLFDKLLAHKNNGRNRRAYKEFMAQMATKAAGTAGSSAETATEEATSRAGADREKARAGARGAGAAHRRKSPEASERMRAAVAKATAERAQRAREAAGRREGSAEMARGATGTATEEATAKGTEVPGAGTAGTTTTTTAATATRAATAEAAAAGATTTAAEIGRGIDKESTNNGNRGSKDTTHDAAGSNDKPAHENDGDVRGDGGGADETRATQRATEGGGSTSGIKKRGQRGGRSEYKAHKAGQRKRSDKYGDKAT